MMLDGDQYQKISADGDPDLRLDGVDRIAEEVLDRQILLEPLEEQFDLPAVFVDGGDRECWRLEQVGQKYQMLAGLGIAKRYATQTLGISRLRFRRGQENGLIGTQSRTDLHGAGGNPGGAQVVLGANDEADLLSVQSKQPGEIQIAPVDDQNRSRWQTDLVEQPDVVHLASGNADEYGYCAPQVDDDVRFYGRFGLPEVSPWKQRQAKVDRRRVHGKDRPLQPKANVLVAIKRQSEHDEALPQCFEQMVIAPLGGIGQRRARNRTANPDVIELRPLRIHTGNQIAQSRAAGQLGVGQADEMAPRRERRNALVRLMHIDQMLEVTERHELQQLRKNRPAMIHDPASSASKSGDDTTDRHAAISNRRNRLSAGNPCQERLCTC